METTENRRVKMTKLLLNESLIELMHTKSIHEITVKELCEKADINRSTFYKHYGTVYDLYAEILQAVNDGIGEIIFRAKTADELYSYKVLENILLYVLDRKELFLLLLGEKSNIGIGEPLINVIDSFLDKETTNEFSRYCVQFLTAGMTSIVWMWLNGDGSPNAHEMALLIHTMLTHGMKRALAFSTPGNAEGKKDGRA